MQVAEGKVLGPLRKGHSHCWWALMRGKGRFWKCSARSSFPRLPGLFSLQHHLSAELRQTSAPEDSRLQEEGQERERPQGHSRVGGGAGWRLPWGRTAGAQSLPESNWFFNRTVRGRERAKLSEPDLHIPQVSRCRLQWPAASHESVRGLGPATVLHRCYLRPQVYEFV